MSLSALEFLTDDDHAALLGCATLRDCRDGEVIVAQADANRALYLVQEGFVLVQRDVAGVQLSVARMGPGEFFGEMSLLEHAPTSAAVVADGKVTVAVVHVEDIVTLGKDLEGFNERFFRSLAVALSRRLRELGGFVAAMDRYSAEAHQSLVDRLQPPSPSEHHELQERATSLRRSLADSEFASTLGADEDANIRAVFDEVASILRVRGAKGAAVLHRELYTSWMASRTIAGSLLCVGGDSCALPTLDRVQRNQPSGEGFVGPVLDAWFLERPAMEGLRWAAEAVAARLHGDSVTLLGGPQGEVVNVALERFQRISVLERDENGLLEVHARAEGKRVLLAQMSPLELVRGRGRLSLMPTDVVVGVGLLDRIPEDELVHILQLASRLVLPDGVIWLSGTPPGDPDFALYKYLLGWEHERHEADEIVELAAEVGLVTEVLEHPAHRLFKMHKQA